MPTEYIIPSDTSHDAREFRSVIELEEFCNILASNIRVKLCLKASFSGTGDNQTLKEKKPTVSVSKAPPLWLAFDERTDIPHYVVVIDKFAWDGTDSVDRKRLIHLGLSTLAVEVKDDGSVTVKKRQPDVVTFKTTVQRYGLVETERDTLRLDRAVQAGASVASGLVIRNGEEE